MAMPITIFLCVYDSLEFNELKTAADVVTQF